MYISNIHALSVPVLPLASSGTPQQLTLTLANPDPQSVLPFTV